MTRYYCYGRVSPGSCWVRCSRLEHVAPGGQLIWHSYIWRLSPWLVLRECAALLVTAALMAGAIVAMVVWG